MKWYFSFLTLFIQIGYSQESCAQIILQPNLGYGISPKGFPNTMSLLSPFLTEVSNTCGNGVLLINGAWRDNLSRSGCITSLHKTFISQRSAPYNYIDLSVFGWATYPALYLDNPTNPTNNWSNSNTRSAFLKMLIHTADSLHPTYMLIGNEVSFYWTQDSNDYKNNWAPFYKTAYDLIKAHSPATKVGTVFNYEHLSGQGQFSSWNTPNWRELKPIN